MHVPPSLATIGQRVQVPPAPSDSPHTRPVQSGPSMSGGGPVSAIAKVHSPSTVAPMSAVKAIVYVRASWKATS